MGIPTPDPETPYANDCLVCWPTGRAPRVLWASFTGIRTGDLWQPTDPSPPNATYPLHQMDGFPCAWNYGDLNFRVRYSVGAAPSSLLYVEYLFGFMFIRERLELCKSFFTNSIIDCANAVYCGGVGQVSALPPAAATPSMHTVFDLLNIEHDQKHLAELYGYADDKAILKHASKDKRTSILIEFDPTA